MGLGMRESVWRYVSIELGTMQVPIDPYMYVWLPVCFWVSQDGIATGDKPTKDVVV